MQQPVRAAGVAFVAVLLGSQLIRPARTNPSIDPSRTLAARLRVTPEVAAVLDRACRDCHSNETTWPWYSNVAPISWLVIDHVRSGRRHFNYSEWAGYAPDKQRKLLQEICEETRDGSMPVGSYTLVHREARLSEADVLALCAWTETATAAAGTRP